MRVEELRAGTLVGDRRVVGKRKTWANGRYVITVTFDKGAPVPYYAGQTVPGSPRTKSAAFMPAADTRLRHDGQRTRRFYVDRQETAQERTERRNALRLALA